MKAEQPTMYFQMGNKFNVDTPNVWFFADGNSHRANSPVVICSDEGMVWHQNDKKLREDVPAVKYDGGLEWHQHDKKHREDVPVVVYDVALV